ncbi:hypothetical protein BH09PAT1_BH09PAT1_6630 [soil metagenome]
MGKFTNSRSDRERTDDTRNLMGPQMHSATCSRCGKACMVPFRPTGNRPVFCSDCFKTEAGDPARRTDDRTRQTPTDRQMYDAVCSKCGNRCQVPFQPRPGKQIFCSHCFEQKEKGESNFQEKPRNNEDLTLINAKLHKILRLLEASKPSAAVSARKTQEEIKAEPTEEVVKEPSKKAPAKKKASPKKKSSKK